MRKKAPHLTKMATTDESLGRAHRRQWRRMVGRKHQMPCVCIVPSNQSLLGLRMRAPEQKSHGLALLSAGHQQLVREQFPAPFGMAGWLAVFHRERGVEQQNTLLRPMCQ